MADTNELYGKLKVTGNGCVNRVFDRYDAEMQEIANAMDALNKDKNKK